METTDELKKWLNQIHHHYSALKELNRFTDYDGYIYSTYETVRKKIDELEKAKNISFNLPVSRMIAPSKMTEQNKFKDCNKHSKKDIEQRKHIFIEKVQQYSNLYYQEMLGNFCDYWTEHNENGNKMRFELQKVFDINRRLKTWCKNQKVFNSKTQHGGFTKQEFSEVLNANIGDLPF